MNKLRLKFSKNGPIKFIGHLDVMRYFQKAIRRAEIDIKYSEGFSPHQIISFAQPLSVGATSDGEYMDITVNTMNSAEDIMNRLNAVMNEGIEILAIRELSDEDEKAMTAAYAAKYRISFRKKFIPDYDWIEKFREYLSLDTLPAMKKTKKGEKEIDMKPLIFDFSFNKEEGYVELLLSMSSSATLKPALLLQGFFDHIKEELAPHAMAIHRLDIYRLVENEDKPYIEPFITDDMQTRFYLNV